LSPSSKKLAHLLAGSQGPDGDWRKAFGLAFAQLRQEVDLHPVASTPSATFELAARTTRTVAAECLPLGMGLVMHLYPLCAMRCLPLPWWSPANYRRRRLLRDIDRRSLILANAGSERAAGAHAPVTLTRLRDGVRLDGKFDYVSLANTADLVLFSAPLVGSNASLFCVADLRCESARIGPAKFSGSMRLSDTCPVLFENHFVPPGRFVRVPDESALGCMTQYQRSWFQLLSCEAHLARMELLRRSWSLPRDADIAGQNELGLLRDYALRLLDRAANAGAARELARVSAALKLRISGMAQSLAASIQGVDPSAAEELRFLKRQPTSDDRILRSLGAAVPAGTRFSQDPPAIRSTPALLL
jgi:alkylation response protein AidB-like acyl-CoA dehydrogenase